MKRLVEKIIATLFKWIGKSKTQDVIYFESFHGKQFSDNPKAIYDCLKNEYPNLKLVWGVTKGYEAPFLKEEVPFVRRFSLRWFFTMPKACVWVTNTRTPLWLTKSKKTTYIQTWHGTPLKRLGADIWDVNIPGYTKESYTTEFANESQRWDYLLSSSPYTTKHFREAFMYTGEVLDSGYPRNDLLIDVKYDKLLKNRLKEQLEIPVDKRVVLYAPTWRESDSKGANQYSFSIDFPFSDFTSIYGEDSILLVRMHYLVAENLDFSKWPKSVVLDVSTGYDMSQLLAVSDILITDYSSCLFDFSLTNKPMIFYIPDKDYYETQLRGFYFPIESTLPGPIVETKHALLSALSYIDEQENRYQDKYLEFREEFNTYETGQASRQVAKIINQKVVS